MRVLLVAIVTVATASAHGDAPVAPEPAAPAALVARIASGLAGQRWAQRDAARRELRSLVSERVPVAEQLLASSDPNVRGAGLEIIAAGANSTAEAELRASIRFLRTVVRSQIAGSLAAANLLERSLLELERRALAKIDALSFSSGFT